MEKVVLCFFIHLRIFYIYKMLWIFSRFPVMRDWGNPPTTQKLGSSPHVSLLFCLQNFDFIIVMQFLAILPKLYPLQVDPNGKP